MISAIEFVNCYHETLDTIGLTLRDEYKPALDRVKQIDPHDLIGPEQSFQSSNHVYGFIYRLIISNHKDA